MSATKTKHQMQCTLFLDIVITQRASILKLLSGEDETLLIRGNSLLVLNLGLDVVNCVGWLDVKGDGFAGEGFDENLFGTRVDVSVS